MYFNHILNLRHTKIDFLRLKLGVISTPKTAHNQGENNESQKLYYKSYFARHFYAVLMPWATGKLHVQHQVNWSFCALVLLS